MRVVNNVRMKFVLLSISIISPFCICDEMKIKPSDFFRNSMAPIVVEIDHINAINLNLVVNSDPDAICSPFKRINKSQFSGSCIFKKIGMHSLKMESNGNVVGTAVIQVKTNITAVTWGSSAGKNSEPVKFDDLITFTVAGQNLLQDKQLAFAVKDCGESNVEVGTPSNTLRTFQCTFYKAGGAKAGYMPGVVKDEPNGQVLFDGWSVPVEVAAKK